MTGMLKTKRLERACPICDGAVGEVIHTQRFVLPDGHPLSRGYDVVRCAACGFAFADTGVGQIDYDAFYAKTSKYADGRTSSGAGDAPFDAKRLSQTAAAIALKIPDRQARIADVGCATGGLLRALRALGYKHLSGFDPAPSCVDRAAEVPGVDAQVGSLSQIPAPPASFDCVILSHVLEHVRDLRGALAYLRSFLRPGGYLYVETPDATRYADFAFAPFQDFNTEHINHFSGTSLENLLRVCGYAPASHGAKTIMTAQEMPYPAVFAFATIESVSGGAAPALKPDRSLGKRLVEYVSVSRRIMSEIDERLRQVVSSSHEVVVWGTGQLTMKLLAETALANAKIVAFVDGNPVNQGKYLNGIPILAPTQLGSGGCPIIVASILHHSAIVEDIRGLGLPNPVVELRPSLRTVPERSS